MEPQSVWRWSMAVFVPRPRYHWAQRNNPGYRIQLACLQTTIWLSPLFPTKDNCCFVFNFLAWKYIPFVRDCQWNNDISSLVCQPLPVFSYICWAAPTNTGMGIGVVLAVKINVDPSQWAPAGRFRDTHFHLAGARPQWCQSKTRLLSLENILLCS